jgi:dihydroorotase (homodimeric type)
LHERRQTPTGYIPEDCCHWVDNGATEPQNLLAATERTSQRRASSNPYQNKNITMPSPPGTRIEIRLPDDFHHHCRDGAKTAAVLKHAAERFGRCLMMPNLKPPVTSAAAAVQYRQHIINSLPPQQDNSCGSITSTVLEPLMTLYLTDHTTADDIADAVAAGVVAVKYYPAGATTNSAAGVTDIKKCYGALEAMTQLGMMLCIHSEVTHGDIFDRELFFIEEIIKPVRCFSKLSLCLLVPHLITFSSCLLAYLCLYS